MSAGRVTDTHVIVAGGILTVLLAGATAFIGPAGGADANRASSFSAAPEGARAAFLTLSRLGYHIERSYEPMTGVGADPASTVLVLTGQILPSEQDRGALQTFLQNGGTALLVGVQGARFLDVPGASADPFVRPTRHRVVVPSPLALSAAEITMVPAASPPKFDASWVSVFSVRGDQPLVATRRIGSGRAIWWASHTPLANVHISDADNLQLLLNVAGPPAGRRVLWDEHYHGHSRSLWSYAVNTPLPWMGAQLGLMAVALFAGYSRRRGPVRSRAVDARTSPLEFIDMLRALYKRAGASAAALAAARKRLQRATALAAGIPIDSPDDMVARTIAAKTGANQRDVLELLETTRHAAVDPAQALRLTQELQGLTLSVSRVGSAPGTARRQL